MLIFIDLFFCLQIGHWKVLKLWKTWILCEKWVELHIACIWLWRTFCSQYPYDLFFKPEIWNFHYFVNTFERSTEFSITKHRIFFRSTDLLILMHWSIFVKSIILTLLIFSKKSIFSGTSEWSTLYYSPSLDPL